MYTSIKNQGQTSGIAVTAHLARCYLRLRSFAWCSSCTTLAQQTESPCNFSCHWDGGMPEPKPVQSLKMTCRHSWGCQRRLCCCPPTFAGPWRQRFLVCWTGSTKHLSRQHVALLLISGSFTCHTPASALLPLAGPTCEKLRHALHCAQSLGVMGAIPEVETCWIKSCIKQQLPRSCHIHVHVHVRTAWHAQNAR
jgi:hypothetical protein